MRSNIKNEKAITLISLVITIIILLILAGISISALTKSGLFKTAQSATEEYERAEIKEELESEILNIKLGKLQKGEEFKREDLRELENIGVYVEDIRNTSNRRI